MSNDSKYGRLYPERAVAPLRTVMQKLIDNETVSRPMMNAALVALDRDGFPPDEPLFLLRGQDELAPDTVRYYMGIAADRHAPIAKQHDHLYDFALRMERWQPRKLPD